MRDGGGEKLSQQHGAMQINGFHSWDSNQLLRASERDREWDVIEKSWRQPIKPRIDRKYERIV